MEYSARVSGISLALVAGALGYKPHFAFSDVFKGEKRAAMLGHPLCSIA
jgi:cysteine synthase